MLPPAPLPPVLLGATINLLAGASGVGKSTFLAWFSRQLQDRTPLWGHPWGEVPFQGIICADRSWELSTRRWFDLEGMGGIPAYSLQDDRGFRKARLRRANDRIAVFESCLQHLSPAGDGQFPLGSVVYVDPLAVFLGGNLLDYDRCMVACMEIREICLDKGITIIGTAHASKQSSDKSSRYLRLQDRILGSSALYGYTDTQLFLAGPEELDKPYYGFLWHPHHAPTCLFSLTRNKQDHGRFIPGELIETNGEREEAERTVESLPEPTGGPVDPWVWIEPLLQKGDLSFAQLMIAGIAYGCSRAALARRLRELVDQHLLHKPGHGVYGLVRH